MRRWLISLVAFLVTIPLFAAAPRFGREIPAAPYEYGDPGRAISNAAIATDGDGYLAAWGDSRIDASSGTVRIARLTADGTLLDKTGILLGPGSYPAVIWTGESYVVAWRVDAGVMIAKVGRDGAVSGTRLILEGMGGADVALATTGRTIAVGMNGGPIALLERDLSVVARGAVAMPGARPNTLAVAAAGDRYMFAYVLEPGRIYTQPLAENGTLGAPQRISDADGANMVSIASDGTSYLLLWTTAASQLKSVRISNQSELLSAARTLVSSGPATGSNPRVLQSPHLVWSGGEYIATYVTSGGPGFPQEASALVISRDGETSGSGNRFGIASGFYHAGIAAKSNGTGAVIWTDDELRARVGLYDAMSIASSDPFRKRVSASNAARAQRGPAIVAVEQTPVVAWMETAVDFAQVRIARAGGNPIVVADAAPERVWLTYDGATIAVVWQTSLIDVYVRRYTRALEPIDAAPLRALLSVASRIESVAAGSGRIAFTSSREYEGELFFTRLIENNGGLSAVSTRLSPDRHENVKDNSSVLVWDGSRFAAVWVRRYLSAIPEADPDAAIYGTYIDPQGRVTPPNLLYDTQTAILSSVRGAARDGRVVIGWQELAVFGLGEAEGTKVYVAEFDGSAVERQLIDENLELFTHLLTDLEIHRDGRVDAFTLTWPESRDEATIRLFRLTRQLQPDGPPYVSEAIAGLRPHLLFDYEPLANFDAAIAGDHAVMSYVRRDDSAEAGSVTRVFLRGEAGPSQRRRAVR